MLLLMRDLDQKHRLRQMTLAVMAALGFAILALAVSSAGSAPAHADTRSASLTAEDRADLDRVSAYLSNLTDMQGNFLSPTALGLP